jgi:Zn-dependent protease with chaperone function
MIRRDALGWACAHCALLALAPRRALAEVGANWTAPARFAAPDPASDEGGLWAMIAHEEQRIRRSQLLMRDRELHDYLHTVACKLGGEHCPDIRIYPIRTPWFNASMAPNGMMQVWSGLLLRVDNEAQLAAILGHEMGHYVLHHVLYGLVAAAVGLLVGLYIMFHLSRWVFQRFGPRWRIPELHDWAAFPMIFLLAGIMGFFAEPVGNAYSRHIEHQADVYGLEVTHGINANSQEVAAHSFQILGELSLDYPYPNRLEVFWYWSHPPIADRLRFAQEYDPWDKGQPTRYVK